MIREAELSRTTVKDVCWCYADTPLGRQKVSFMGTRISLYRGEGII